MTRKHFEAIARTIEYCTVPGDAREVLATNMAHELAQFNSNFNRARFIAACGVAA